VLDLISLGRINLDLSAEQAGAPLDDVPSFRTSVGGNHTGSIEKWRAGKERR